MNGIKGIKNMYNLLTVCLILVGLILLLAPGIALNTVCTVFGIYLIVYGVVKVIGYFAKDVYQLAFQFDFAMGIISCLIGVVMLFRSRQFMETLIIGMGLFILADALLRVQTAFDAKRIGVKQWWLILIMSLVTAVIGTLLFLKPYNGTEGVMILIGLNLVIDGILNLFVVQSTVDIIKRKNEWKQVIK